MYLILINTLSRLSENKTRNKNNNRLASNKSRSSSRVLSLSKRLQKALQPKNVVIRRISNPSLSRSSTETAIVVKIAVDPAFLSILLVKVIIASVKSEELQNKTNKMLNRRDLMILWVTLMTTKLTTKQMKVNRSTKKILMS